MSREKGLGHFYDSCVRMGPSKKESPSYGILKDLFIDVKFFNHFKSHLFFETVLAQNESSLGDKRLFFRTYY